jgi:hypothetical protein
LHVAALSRARRAIAFAFRFRLIRRRVDFARAAAATALVAAVACGDSTDASGKQLPWDRITGQIAYTGDSGAYILDGALRSVRRLYTDGHGSGFADLAWSAQGDRLMLAHMPTIFVVGQPAPVGASLIEVNGEGAILRGLGGANDDICCAAYSRDGRVAYLNKYKDLWIDGSLAIANVLTNSRPAWTPDSRFVLLSSGGVTGTDQLYRVNPATGERTLAFPNSPGRYVDPVFSPDGSRIAFVRPEPDVSGLQQIWSIAADGTDARQLTHSFTDSRPSWSSDGTQLVFVRKNIGRGEYRFAIMRADGTDVTDFQVPRDATFAPHISWRP